MRYFLGISLIFGGCSLAVSDAPDGGLLIVQADAQTTTTDSGAQRPAADAGSTRPDQDAGSAGSFDAGPRAALADCSDDLRADLIGHQCVPITGTTTVCRDTETLRRDHSWARDAAVVRYAAPRGAGDGSSAEQAGSLSDLIVAAGAGSTAIILAQGTYEVSNPLALGVRGPLSLIGACAQSTTIELAAPMTAGVGSTVQIYGLGVRGPLSAEEGAKASAITMQDVSSFKLMQSTITAAAGHGLELSGSGAGGALLSGVTFEGVRDSAMHATDALGSWTVEGNLCRGPIGEHGMAFAGGDANVTLRSNQFEGISGDAMRASDALGSWTVEGNLCRGPIGGDAISIAGGSAEASMNISNNTFEQINGNAISAQDALGSWTVEGNLCRGTIGGHAMHFHNQGGTMALTGNTVSGSARGVLANGGSAAWTVSDNTVGGAEQGAGPSGGFEFIGLAAEGSLSVTGNTLNHVGGLAMSFMNSQAAATVTGNIMSNSWGDQGGELLSRHGIGLIAVDSSAMTITNNTIEDNAQAGVVFDLGWWDPDANGAARLSLTDNVISGHDHQYQIVRQNIPGGSQVASFAALYAANDLMAPRTPRPIGVSRSETPAPPRCGDGVVDAGEACDYAALDAPFPCKDDCTLSHGVRHLAASNRGICAAVYDGTIRCIGAPSEQFGPQWPESADRNQFTTIPNTSDFEQVALGSEHGCGLKRDGRVWCWGDNTSGQAPGLANSNPPTQVQFDSLSNDDLDQDPFVSVYAAQTHSCARQQGGHVWCWGRNPDGALGLGGSVGVGSNTAPRRLRRAFDDSFLDASEGFWTGARNSCAKRLDVLVCWGHGRNLATPDNITLGKFNANYPIDGPNMGPLAVGDSVTIGVEHMCAINRLTLQPFCWGNNSGYRLGTGNETHAFDRAVAVNVGINPPDFTKVYTATNIETANVYASCAMTSDHQVWCWGVSAHGIHGVATIQTMARPVAIEGLDRPTQLALTGTKACAIQRDDSVRCWGIDRFGDASAGTSHQPLRHVSMADTLQDNPPSFTELHLGASFSLATEPHNGRIRAYGWGLRTRGENNSILPRIQRIDHQAFLPNFEADAWAVSDYAICARDRTDILCKGQLGGGVNQGQEDYIGAVGQTDVLRCGGNHCCAFAPNTMSAVCWGRSNHGQAGSVGSNVAPTTVSLSSPIQDLALGQITSCARTTAGVECWGDNEFGQFGNGANSIAPSITPVVAIEARFQQFDHLAAGDQRLFCGSNSNSLWCWGQLDEENNGYDLNGREGQFSNAPVAIPVPIPLLPVHQVAADQYAACAILGRGETKDIACLGNNYFGVIDPNSFDGEVLTDLQITHQDVGDITRLALKEGRGCLIANNQVMCWGRGAVFEMGSNLITDYFSVPDN